MIRLVVTVSSRTLLSKYFMKLRATQGSHGKSYHFRRENEKLPKRLITIRSKNAKKVKAIVDAAEKNIAVFEGNTGE